MGRGAPARSAMPATATMTQPLDRRRFDGPLQHPAAGATTTSRSTTPAHSSVHPGGPRRAGDRSQGAGRRGARARHRPAAADPLLGDHKARVVELNEAFARAIAEYGYKGVYRGVYPIKVNQHRYVVEQIVDVRPALPLRPRGRLQARAARGHGDARGRGSADHLQRLQGRGVHRDRAARHEARPQRHPRGREAVRAAAHPPTSRSKTGVRPRIGIRARSCPPAAPATGRPRAATARSSASPPREILERRRLPARATSCSTASSCCTSTSAPRSPPSARSRTPCARRRASTSSCSRWARRCSYLDVGGGLGVDYDGSQTNFASSMNYTCRSTPTTSSSASWRSATRATCRTRSSSPSRAAPSSRITRCWSSTSWASPSSTVGKLPTQVADGRRAARCSNLFDDLPRGVAEEPARGLPRRPRLQGRVPEPVQPRPPVARGPRPRRGPVLGDLPEDPQASCATLPQVPEDLEGLEQRAGRHLLLQLLGVPVAARLLGDRSALPDHADPPAQRGADAPRRARRHHLRLRRQDRPLHRPPRRQARARAAPAQPGEPYYLGIFLVGAYQEILGDLHNLFGDTNTVHVVARRRGRAITIDDVVTGDTRDRRAALRALQPRTTWWRGCASAAEVALRAKRMTLEESRRCCAATRKGSSGYTYLEQD